MISSNFKYDVFISYNQSDKEWVLYLAKRLKRRKFKVFLDEWGIRVGESIPAGVRRGLRESRYIILIMTPEWVNSEWCQLETDTVVVFDPSARRRRIIPILLKDCEIPDDIVRLKYIDFRNSTLFEENFDLLVKNLKNKSFGELLEKIVEKQRIAILNFPILPWTPEGSPSFDFLWPDLFIEPHIRSHKHLAPPTPFYDWVNNYDWKSNIAIVGLPGIGKSMLLRAIFLKLTDPKDNLQVKGIPILVNASEILEFKQNRYKSLVSYLILHLGVQIPRSLISRKSVVLLVDGLDEVAEYSISSVLSALIDTISINTNVVLWIACRKEFFFRNIAIKPKWNTPFYEIIELLEWDENRDSLVFASKYAEKTRQPFLYHRLLALKHEYPKTTPFLRNPFELTLLLYLLSDEKPLSHQHLKNSYALYNAFYGNWVIREHHRGTAPLPPEMVSELHRCVASALYSSKGIGINLQEVVDKIDPKIPLTALTTDTSFIGLLRVKVNLETSQVKIERFWHETIGEFLVAEGLIDAFKEGSEALFKALTAIYNYEVNVFVRGAFQCMSMGERENIFRNFKKLYIDLFSSDSKLQEIVSSVIRQGIKEKIVEYEAINQSEQDTRIREQILYYIGRLPLPFFPEILRFAYHNEPASLLRRIAALGAMLYGDENIERDYLNKLILGSAEDEKNRSVQLVYFGDVEGDIHTYYDDGKYPWTRTRSAIYQRLRLDSQREMRLRWWDLRTLYLFYASRKWTKPLTNEEFDILVNSSIVSDEFSDAKKKDIAHEKRRLIEKLKPLVKGDKR